MLISDLCDYSDAYIIVKGGITFEGNNDANKRNKSVEFKNNAPFINCISKINDVNIDNAEDLDIVMPTYNLLEYSENYRNTTGSFWNYYRDEPRNPLSCNFECFKYKTNIIWKTLEVNDSLANTKVVIQLKHLSNFWKSLNIPIINCEVEFVLTWTKNCVLADMTVRDEQGNNPAIVAPSGAIFKIRGAKLYVPVATLSKEKWYKAFRTIKIRF